MLPLYLNDKRTRTRFVYVTNEYISVQVKAQIPRRVSLERNHRHIVVVASF